MNGLACLRKALNLTGEEFGNYFGIGKTAISKMESGKLAISRNMKQAIASKFGCDPELLDKEVNEIEQSKIKVCAYQYGLKQQGPQSSLEYDYSLWDELRAKEDAFRWQELLDNLENNPEAFRAVERLMKLIQGAEGREIVHILIAAGELYQNGYFSDSLAIGRSDYRRGTIRKDDPAINIIVNTLSLTLNKVGK